MTQAEKLSPFIMCNECGIIINQINSEGFPVCEQCGLVLENFPPLIYHRPYKRKGSDKNNKIQHSPKNRMKIGFPIELEKFPKFKKLDKRNRYETHKQERERLWCFETLRFLSNLHLSLNLKNEVLNKIKEFYSQFEKSSRIRSFSILVPISIIFTCLERNITISFEKLHSLIIWGSNTNIKTFFLCFKKISEKDPLIVENKDFKKLLVAIEMKLGEWNYEIKENYNKFMREYSKNYKFEKASDKIDSCITFFPVLSPLREYVRTISKKFHNQIKEGTKYRNFKYILPVVIYIGSLENGIFINLKKLLKFFVISKKNFHQCLFLFYRKNRNLFFRHRNMDYRKSIILTNLKDLNDKFIFPDFFLKASEQILDSHFEKWNTHPNTVITAFIFRFIKERKKTEMRDFTDIAICDHLGIKSSVTSNNRELWEVKPEKE